MLILRTTHSLGELVYGRLDVQAEVLAGLIMPLVSIYHHSELPWITMDPVVKKVGSKITIIRRR